MRALWLEEGRLEVREVPEPSPGPGEALVRVRRAGLCNTDLELRRGYYPFRGVPGHEFVGEVVSAPGAPGRVGTRVVGEINLPCGDCPRCQAGQPRHCPRRRVLGLKDHQGALAERLVLPLANLHEVPASLADEVAVFVEPTAAACRVLEQVAVGAGSRVVVLGAGKLGSLVAQVLAATGCALTVATRRPETAPALRARGLELLAPADLPEHAADVVVDCTGSPEGLRLAHRLVRAEGTIVLKSTHHGEAPQNLSPLVVDEVRVVGSRCGPFARALDLLAGGRVDPAALVEHRLPLSDAPAAFDLAARPGALKVLVDTTA